MYTLLIIETEHIFRNLNSHLVMISYIFIYNLFILIYFIIFTLAKWPGHLALHSPLPVCPSHLTSCQPSSWTAPFHPSRLGQQSTDGHLSVQPLSSFHCDSSQDNCDEDFLINCCNFCFAVKVNGWYDDIHSNESWWFVWQCIVCYDSWQLLWQRVARWWTWRRSWRRRSESSTQGDRTVSDAVRGSGSHAPQRSTPWWVTAVPSPVSSSTPPLPSWCPPARTPPSRLVALHWYCQWLVDSCYLSVASSLRSFYLLFVCDLTVEVLGFPINYRQPKQTRKKEF